jgi:hypothetical protein
VNTIRNASTKKEQEVVIPDMRANHNNKPNKGSTTYNYNTTTPTGMAIHIISHAVKNNSKTYI